MGGVLQKFIVVSLFMWVAPVAILYGFDHNLFSGIMHMDSHYLTLWSGFLAVISVNIVIAFYIWLAMKEPSDKHVPDPRFLAEAKASISQSRPLEAENSSEPREKKE